MINFDNKPYICLFTDKRKHTWRQNLLFRHYLCIFVGYSNTIKYSKSLHFTFNVRQYFPFIGDYQFTCVYR